MVKVKYSAVICCEEIIVRLSTHCDDMYFLSLDHTRNQVILCYSCSAAYLLLVEVKAMRAHFSAVFYENNQLVVNCCVKCLRVAISRYR